MGILTRARKGASQLRDLDGAENGTYYGRVLLEYHTKVLREIKFTGIAAAASRTRTNSSTRVRNRLVVLPALAASA